MGHIPETHTFLTPERYVRVALTALTKTPKLKGCTQASFYKALMTCAQLGLEPDGYHAHLIPFGDECQLVVDYKGLVEVVMRSERVSHIHADVVHENDEFDYNLGKVEIHRPNLRGDRGKVYAVYCVVTFKDGSSVADVMTKEDVEKVRARSKAGRNGPWVTDWNEMAKKTVFKRLSKWLPISSKYRDAIEHDFDRLPEIEATVVTPKPLLGAPEEELGE